jgi:enoyl-CoA hydratase
MAESPVLLTHEHTTSLITVNRPEALNALDAATLGALGAAIAEVAARRETRCLIVTGAGEKAFVAGADIAAMRAMTREQGLAFAQQGQAVFAALEALDVPVIAAVNGFALGGGCELALACDFVIASNKAKFGQPEVKLGIIPGFGGTQRLMRKLPAGLARELIYTGRMLGAEEALRLGLVVEVVPREELLPRAHASAQQIAKVGPRAVAAAKRLMLEGAALPLDAAIAREAEAFAACFGVGEQAEGMGAFLDKREPRFSDR